MTVEAGILAAFLAFLAWGFGDFAIQRSVRRVGAVPALFFIGIFGLVIGMTAGIFVLALSSQRRIIALRNAEDNIRFTE